MAFPTTLTVVLTILLLLIPLATARLLSILPPRAPRTRPRGSKTHILIILGSGGHTAELLSILRRSYGEPGQWNAFTYRTWVVSSGDGFSASFAREFERSVGGCGIRTYGQDGKAGGGGEGGGDGEEEGGYRIVEVPRARRIHQPLYTAPLSCLQCLVSCLRLLTSSPTSNSTVMHTSKSTSTSATTPSGPIPLSEPYPDLILSNGPATAAILIYTTLLLRFFNYRNANSDGKMRTIYVESWARVKKLSLSGRLLVCVVDRFMVQWESLSGVGGRGEFGGVLVG